MKKVISFLLAAVCMISVFSAMSLSASAATANANVSEVAKVTIQNVGTGQYLNFDYGTLKNGTSVRVWPWDGSTEQLWDIDKVNGTTYRILTHKSGKYCLDVYRGSAKLKAGQKCDIWKTGDDSVAQNVTFYLCNDGSYIIRMANNSDLALAATASKDRVKLVKFDSSSKAQKWIIKDAKGNKIDIMNISTTTTNVSAGIPTSAYVKTGVVYTICGAKYYQAKTTRAYNGVAKDSLFFVDTNGAVVNNASTLNKLQTLVLFNDMRQLQKDVAEGWVNAAEDYYDIYTAIAKNEKMGSLIGKSSGLLLSVGTGSSFGIQEAALEIGSEVFSPETVKSAVLLGMLRVYSNNTMVYGTQAANLMQNTVTDYDTMLECANLYAECAANFAAVDYLAGDQIREMARSSVGKELTKYFKNVFLGFADSVVPDIKSVQITKYVTDGVIALGDFAINSGAKAVYDKKIAEQNKYLAINYAAVKIMSDKLTENEWDSLVGTTVASIKNGSSYTKWYNSSNNVSAKGGYTGQCTWYALGRFYEVTGINLGKAPHAKSWLSANKNNTNVKILYGASNIVPKSIAVDTNGTYGHVVFIEHVEYDSDGNPQYVYFTECNWDCNGTYNSGKDCILKKMTYSAFITQRSPDGYIVAK